LQKIKKQNPIKPVKNCLSADDIVSFIKTDKKEPKRKGKTGPRTDRSQPSKFPSLSHWKSKTVDKWTMSDFIGFYLQNYLDAVGKEDSFFIGRPRNDMMSKERSKIESYLKMYFVNNKTELKDYICFIVKWWMTEEAFPDGLPNFNSIFGPRGYFIKEFQNSQIKVKKKVLKKRKEGDANYAEKDIWNK